MRSLLISVKKFGLSWVEHSAYTVAFMTIAWLCGINVLWAGSLMVAFWVGREVASNEIKGIYELKNVIVLGERDETVQKGRIRTRNIGDLPFLYGLRKNWTFDSVMDILVPALVAASLARWVF